MNSLIKTKEDFIRYISRTSTIPTGIDGPTPHVLIESMFEKLTTNIDWKNPNLKILDPAFGFGSFLFFSYLKLKEYHSDKHILHNMLYGVEIEPFRFELVKRKFKIKNIFKEDFLNPSNKLNKILNMKFDVIIGNPPYQMQVGPNKTETIWDKFVIKSINQLNENGYLCLIHPSGWRNVDGKFRYVQNELKKFNIIYLEMHDKSDGLKTFGAATTYDWYIVEKSNKKTITTLKLQNGNIIKHDLKELPFIPSGDFHILDKLLAKENEECINVIYSSSSYETRNPHMKANLKGTYKYPCVYMIKVNGEPKLHYSSVNNKGHFGIPKLIWGNGGYEMGSFLDVNGEYALTQFAYAISDNIKNLPLIKKAFDSKEFRNVMKSFDGGDSNINRKVISLFRKDFWKQFI